MKNFKLLVAMAAMLVSSSAAWAEGKVAIGVQGGLTFPDFKVTGAPSGQTYGNDNGWLAGLYGEFGVWAITLRPELNYVTKGYNVAGIAEVKNHYLEIPVLVKINPLTDAAFSPFIVVGPQWSRRISNDVTRRGTTASFTDNSGNWDLAGVAGLGLEFNLSQNIGFNVQGRYAYGFRDMGSNGTEVRNRGFYALAGLSFQNAF